MIDSSPYTAGMVINQSDLENRKAMQILADLCNYTRIIKKPPSLYSRDEGYILRGTTLIVHVYNSLSDRQINANPSHITLAYGINYSRKSSLVSTVQELVLHTHSPPTSTNVGSLSLTYQTMIHSVSFSLS